MVTYTCYLSYCIKHKILVHVDLSIKEDPISYLEIDRAIRAEGMTQVIQCSSSKYEALSSNPSTTKKIDLC
jgi:hypothetical protein